MGESERRRLRELLERFDVSESNIDEEELRKISLSLSGEEEGSEGSDLENSSDTESLSLPGSLLNIKSHGVDMGGGGSHTAQIQQGEHEVALSALRTEYELRVGFLEETVAAAQRDKNLALKQLQKERSIHEAIVKELQEQSMKELQVVRESQLRLESEIPVLRQRLVATKETFQDLQISDSLYHQLKQRRLEELSVKEYLAVQFHEAVTASKDELDQARREVESMRDALAAAHESKMLEVRRGSQRLLAAESKAMDLEQSVEQLEATVSSLNFRLGTANAKVEELIAKGRAYDKVASEAERLTSEVEGLAARLSSASAELASTRDQRDDLLARERDNLQKLEILATDKKYLAKESDAASERARNAEAKVERLQQKVRDLKKAKDDYCDQLLISKERNRTEYEDRLANEIHKIKEASTKELEDIRVNSREVYERENRNLRQSREEALQNFERESSKVALLQAHIDELKLSQSMAIASHETTLSDLRNELKLKSFEMERLSVNYEEQQTSFRQSKLENEMLTQKLTVLKIEFSQLQSQYDKEVSELKAQLASDKEKLRSYEELEIEYDNAVVQAGNLMGGDKDVDARLFKDTFDIGIPTAVRRRVKQSLMLAQRLLKCQNEIAGLKKLVEDSEKRARQAKTDLDTERRISASVDQPKGYLVERIRVLEREASQAEVEITALKDQLAHAQDEISSLTHSKAALESHVTTLLSQKQELIAMRAKVLKLRQESEEAKLSLSKIPDQFTSSSNVIVDAAVMPEKENQDQNVVSRLAVQQNKIDPAVPQNPVESKEIADTITQDNKKSVHEYHADSSFILHSSDASGAPLPPWYKKLRRP